MRLNQPPSCEVRYYRRHADSLHCGIELTDDQATTICLDRFDPQTVINLAGENRPDVVEQAPGSFHVINVLVPQRLASWCDDHKAHYVHMSSQAVFSGDNPPYGPESDLEPINAYGQQKTEAERLQIGWGMQRSARRMMTRIIRAEHPDWTDEHVAREVAGRFSHGG